MQHKAGRVYRTVARWVSGSWRMTTGQTDRRRIPNLGVREVEGLEGRLLLDAAPKAITWSHQGVNRSALKTPQQRVLTLGTDLIYRDSVNRVGEVDRIRFRVDQPLIVDARMTLNRAGATLRLFGADGKILGQAVRGPGRTSSFTASLAPGTYLLTVRSTGSGVHRYGLNLSARLPIPPTPTPTPIPVPTPIPIPVPTPSPSQRIETDAAIVYIPSHLESGRLYPVQVTFDPGGNAQGVIDTFQGLAEQTQTILYASKIYHNSVNSDEQPLLAWVGEVKRSLENVFATTPADRTRVIMTGFSGGGSFAHLMNFVEPGLASALIINTAMIWGPQIPDDGTLNGPNWYDTVANDLAKYRETTARSRRLIAFLSSPGDFRDEELHRDQTLYQDLGWTTDEIRFAGGHALAPLDVYAAAFAWIRSQPGWA